MTHICVSKLTIIGSDNGLSPGRHQAFIWTNAGILLILTWGQISVKSCAKFIYIIYVYKKMHLKMSSAKWRQFCLGLNMLTNRVAYFTWWRHQMETFSALLAICAGNSRVTGDFPAQRPVTRRFDVFFDLRLNKRLSKQSWDCWLETPSRLLWRHSNVRSWDGWITCSVAPSGNNNGFSLAVEIHSVWFMSWYPGSRTFAALRATNVGR